MPSPPDPAKPSPPPPPARSERSLPETPFSESQGVAGKRITLCVTGSIAAYKAVVLLRLLLAEHAEVKVVMSPSAREFVGTATFSGLTGEPVYSDPFDPALGGEPHVALAKASDLVLVVPATADLLARAAGGRADDPVSALLLCATCPVLIAPAMHPAMWAHPATQRNVDTLRGDQRVTFVGPVEGEVASGDRGLGRMAEPEAIFAQVVAELSGSSLDGRHIVVTAGPTEEAIDPVRYVGNRSSGKMGFAIAERAARRGAKVSLIAGPVSLATPPGVTRHDVRSAVELRTALWNVLGPDLSGADALVMAAAVADYRPATPSQEKLRRGAGQLALELVPNPDLLAEIGRARRGTRPVLIGFALGTEADERAVASARAKLADKRVDLVVANHADESIGKDDIRALIVGARTCELIERTDKRSAAERILDRLSAELATVPA
ncbi:MAG TPA: bifunctional phosphopantothenoylcysteine decarboxylase/phosphopantothenate--cysteine ligase CoaBC [Polyangiaceae bacterium]